MSNDDGGRAFVSWVLTGCGPRTRPAPPKRTALEASAFRRWIAPGLLLATTPMLVIVLWMICAHFDGSIARFVTRIDLATFAALFPRPTATALAILVGWASAQAVLLAKLPGRDQLGAITPTGQRPQYRLNGVAAWALTHGALAVTWGLGLWSATTVFREMGAMLVILNAFALALCAFLYWKGRHYPSSSDATYTGHFLFDFFQGIELHPRLLGVDLKQLLNCRVSMMGWSVLLLCFAAYQHEAHGHLSSAMLVSTGLVVVYLLKFFVWEGGYFNSLDIIHDRYGFYVCWGVLVWVPSVYTIFGLYLADHPRELHPAIAGGIGTVGVLALWANFAADAQRQRVRRTEGKTTVWGRPPELLTARYRTSDGGEHTNLLLVSGFWGLARHFHYVPELTLALCWALPAGFTDAIPYAYQVFLTVILFDRANRDDARCGAKYGAAWDEYRRRVPAKIIPGIF